MDAKSGRDRCRCGRELHQAEASCPTCGQLRIDYSPRGAQLRLLREWKPARSYRTYDGRTISGATVKTVLRAIDDVIAAENFERRRRSEATTQQLPIRRQRLSDDTGLSLHTIRRAIRVLSDADSLSVLDAEETRIGESPGHILMIDWALFGELAAAPPPEAAPRAKAVSKTRSPGDSSRPRNASQPPTTHFQPPTGHFQPPTVGGSSLYAHNALTLSPSPQDEREDLDELIRRAATANVYAARQLVGAAVDRCGAGHVADLLDHFDRHAATNRWDGQKLATRLKNAHATIPPATAWGASQTPQAARREEYAELNLRFGIEIDRLDRDEFVALAAEVVTDPVGGTMVQEFGFSARSERAVRLPLLKHFAAQAARRSR